MDVTDYNNPLNLELCMKESVHDTATWWRDATRNGQSSVLHVGKAHVLGASGAITPECWWRSEVEVKRKFANDPAIYDSWTVGPVLRLWMTGACTIAQF